MYDYTLVIDYYGDEATIFALVMVFGGMFVVIGLQLLTKAKYAYSKEAKSSKLASGSFSLVLGALIISFGYFLFRWFLGEMIDENENYFAGLEYLYVFLALVSLSAFFGNRDYTDYYKYEAMTKQRLGILCFVIFAAAAAVIFYLA